MTKFLLTVLHLFIFASLKSQVKALTENGREVVLYENGTWKYSSSDGDSANSSNIIPVNPTEYHKTPGATFPVKSNVFAVAVYMDHNKWTFTPHKEGEGPEYTFEMKSKNGFAMMLTEKTQVELEYMRGIALDNARKAAPDAKLVHAEWRTVNNIKVLCLTISGTIQGIKFVYFGYYYTNANGTIQLIAYGSDNMYKESFNEWQDFLDGFSALN